jgi:hypothetical protein
MGVAVIKGPQPGLLDELVFLYLKNVSPEKENARSFAPRNGAQDDKMQIGMTE